MIFSGCGTHLHHAMEINGNNACWEQAEEFTWSGALPSRVEGSGWASIRTCVCWHVAAVSLRSWCHEQAQLQRHVHSSALRCETAGFWSSFGFPALPSVRCRHAPYDFPFLSLHAFKWHVNMKEETLRSVL